MPDAPRSWRLGFWSLIATQFQGAFNDNALKFLVIYLIIGTNLTPDEEETKVLLVGALFALPFILFSMTGGYLADRFSKRTVTIGTKIFEIGVMVFAIAGFAVHSMPMSLAALFLASTQGALFGPSKYGLLPEILPEKRLVLGQWRHRTGHIPGRHCRHRGWRATLRSGSAGARNIRGSFFLACSVVGLVTSFGITQSSRCRSRQEIPTRIFWAICGRNGRTHRAGPRVVARRRRQHLFFLSRRVAAV